MVFGLQTQPKSWLTGYTFWVNHYLEIVFSKISVVNPPPLNKSILYISHFLSNARDRSLLSYDQFRNKWNLGLNDITFNEYFYEVSYKRLQQYHESQ